MVYFPTNRGQMVQELSSESKTQQRPLIEAEGRYQIQTELLYIQSVTALHQTHSLRSQIPFFVRFKTLIVEGGESSFSFLLSLSLSFSPPSLSLVSSLLSAASPTFLRKAINFLHFASRSSSDSWLFWCCYCSSRPSSVDQMLPGACAGATWPPPHCRRRWTTRAAPAPTAPPSSRTGIATSLTRWQPTAPTLPTATTRGKTARRAPATSPALPCSPPPTPAILGVSIQQMPVLLEQAARRPPPLPGHPPRGRPPVH